MASRKNKLKKVSAILGWWKLRRLGLAGKMTVGASQLTSCISSPVQTNNKVKR